MKKSRPSILRFTLPPSPLKRIPPPADVLKNLESSLVTPAFFALFDVQKFAIEKLIRTFFAEAIADGELNFLENHWLKIEITDVKLTWYISIEQNGPKVVAGCVAPDIVIRGQIKEFVSLINRLEGPDSLYFQRGLRIEGEKELVSKVKNALSSLELPLIPQKGVQLMEKLLILLDRRNTDSKDKRGLFRRESAYFLESRSWEMRRY